MKYSYSKNLNLIFSDAEKQVRSSLKEIGFGVLTEINIKDAFKSKLDLDFKNYKILGACNPKLAHDAIMSESLIGVLMPCNIVLIDNENQTTKIVFPYAKNLLEVTGNDKIFKLADKVDSLMKSAFDNIN
ncbi:MAG: hypothetical protein CMF96_12040 [Candidatus Marinimicrobia bacterium]|nr:hypothetical protein [Candidatus Neomarinimicrobiota bacterium]|tara:strand:+ start:2399 stop:2788 length:390 start_codon:yes stop_codon:yes gene_type:complete